MWIVVLAVVIVSIRSGKIAQWLLIVLGSVPMAHVRTSLAIIVKGICLLGLPCSAVLIFMSAVLVLEYGSLLSIDFILSALSIFITPERDTVPFSLFNDQNGLELSGSSESDEKAVLVS